jgi:hypothetical protein
MVLNAPRGTVHAACSAFASWTQSFHCLLTACYTVFKRFLIVTVHSAFALDRTLTLVRSQVKNTSSGRRSTEMEIRCPVACFGGKDCEV